jgi:hypothetical protein
MKVVDGHFSSEIGLAHLGPFLPVEIEDKRLLKEVRFYPGLAPRQFG